MTIRLNKNIISVVGAKTIGSLLREPRTTSTILREPRTTSTILRELLLLLQKTLGMGGTCAKFILCMCVIGLESKCDVV